MHDIGTRQAAGQATRARQHLADHTDCREEIWALHQATAELGGMLRTGVEDTFCLPGSERTSGNGQMIEALALCTPRAGREVASPEEARALLGLRAAAEFGAV